MTGDALTFVAPEEEADLRAIEKAVGRRLVRMALPDFDAGARQAEPLEIPIRERIAAIRARKAEERARAKQKAERRSANEVARGGSQASRPAAHAPRPMIHTTQPARPAAPSGSHPGSSRRRPGRGFTR